MWIIANWKESGINFKTSLNKNKNYKLKLFDVINKNI